MRYHFRKVKLWNRDPLYYDLFSQLIQSDTVLLIVKNLQFC